MHSLIAQYLGLLITILLPVIVLTNNHTNGLEDNIVQVYKCAGSKLPIGKEIVVPSYPFFSEVKLRIKDNNGFPGCSSQFEEVDYYFMNETDDLEEIIHEEMSALEYEVSINPGGFLSVKRHYYPPDEYCISSYTDNGSGDKLPQMVIEYCPQRQRSWIQKCCAVGKSIQVIDGVLNGCRPSGNHKTWKGFFYDENSWKKISETTSKKFNYYKYILNGTNNGSCNPNNTEIWYNRASNDSDKQSFKLLTNGRIIYISPHRRWELLDETDFCIDGIQDDSEIDDNSLWKEENQIVAICSTNSNTRNVKTQSAVYMFFLFGTSIFFLLTAIVHVLLWETQTTYGWTVFSLCLSQFFMRVFLGNAHRIGLDGSHENRRSWQCVGNAILAHFFMLSSFTWLVVINFNIWLAFRVLTPRNRSKKLTDFVYYSIVAWGIPLIVVSVGLILEHEYPDRESLVLIPDYGDEICFVATWAQGEYIYYIMAVLLTISICLGAMTFIKLYGFQQETSSVRTTSSAKDRKLFVLYAKLSAVLGMSWIFEFISWVVSTEDNQHWIWIIFDLYNLITALFIFIIFVCKKSILAQLEEKYPWIKPMTNCRVFKCGKSSMAQSETSGVTGMTSTTQNGGKIAMKTYGTGNNGFKDSDSSILSSASAISATTPKQKPK